MNVKLLEIAGAEIFKIRTCRLSRPVDFPLGIPLIILIISCSEIGLNLKIQSIFGRACFKYATGVFTTVLMEAAKFVLISMK